ncbi:alpha/beta hydrolase family protein [Ceratobasidium sp. AG-Ba]|nr:alpha/beta hydrolase family protein [Ceratobasidium sp. AG-Ba]
MIVPACSTVLSALVLCLIGSTARQIRPVWETLPPTPALPGNPAGTKTPVNGIHIWHAEFGTNSASTLPIIMLHGGFGSSNYWGDVVEILMNKHYVITMDTRGQGRSTMDNTPFSYDLFAQDAAEILKSLGISQAVWVGWSDGADTILAGLLNTTIAPMITRGFITGANHNVAAVNATFTNTTIYNEFVTRAAAEYQTFQPNGNLTALANALTVLGSTQPQWTGSDLAKITLGPLLTMSWGQYEEAVDRSEPGVMHGFLPESKLKILKNASHFGPLQQPAAFAELVETFLS